jgi:hypothetical protein
MVEGEAMSDTEETPPGRDLQRRDWRGRYAPGHSGNPVGRPRGALNRATRIAAELLDGEAEALWRKEIDLALAGDRVLLRHCNDRIIAPQAAQPVAFAMPPIENAAALAAAMGAVLDAAAHGLITPAEAETLARAGEAAARTVALGERIERERFAAERAAVERRFELAACALLFYGVREIDEEAGGLDFRLRKLCKPVLRLGRGAVDSLATISYTPEWLEADRAFVAAHPPLADRTASPLGAAMARYCAGLTEYLDRDAGRLEDLVQEDMARDRQADGEAAKPRYRTGLFERLYWPGPEAGGEFTAT